MLFGRMVAAAAAAADDDDDDQVDLVAVPNPTTGCC